MPRLDQIFINNIFPILAIAGVGYIAYRFVKIPPKPIGSLIYYVFSPALVFYSLYTSEISSGEFASIVAAVILLQLLMAGIAYALMTLQGADPVDRANVMIACVCLNAGNFGLALVSFAFGAEVLSRAVVAFIANVTMNYTFGVFIASNGRKSPKEALLNVLKTPAVYAVIVAFALRGFHIQMPLAIERSAASLSNGTIPLMLILLGLQMGEFTRITKIRFISTGVFIRLIGGPVIAALIALGFGLNQESAIAFIMQASTPTAVLTIIFATEFDLDRDLALNLILGSTLLSPITLSVVIALLM